MKFASIRYFTIILLPATYALSPASDRFMYELQYEPKADIASDVGFSIDPLPCPETAQPTDPDIEPLQLTDPKKIKEKKKEFYDKMSTWKKMDQHLETWQGSLTMLRRYAQEVASYYFAQYNTLEMPVNSTRVRKPVLRGQLSQYMPPPEFMACDPYDQMCAQVLHGLTSSNFTFSNSQAATVANAFKPALISLAVVTATFLATM